MDLLKNPFHILGATTRDNRHSIMELAEERSLLLDTDECMEARSILTNPRRRISAEVAWLPGTNQILTNGFLNLLERSSELRMELFHKLIAFMENVNETGYEQSLFGNEKLIPLSRANLLAAGLSRVHDHLSDDIVQWSGYVYRPSPPTTVQWILEIAKAFDRIEMNELCITINEERRKSGFPEITNLSTIEDELHNRRHYYRQVINLALKDLSIWELAKAVTIGIETATDKGEKHGPILIEDLVVWYETYIQEPLENVERKINIYIEDIRARADAKQTDSNLGFMVNELIRTIKEWNALAQPIQLSKKSRGERHNASFEIAQSLRILAADIFREYGKLDFARNIINMLKEVFAEVPELAEYIREDSKALEEQIRLVRVVERIEEINPQVEKLKETADAKSPDYTLTPMVNQLIQTVKTWDPSTQPIEANNTVALVVRGIALHLWNEHQKSDFSRKILNTLKSVFAEVPDIAGKITKDLMDLEEQTRLVKSMEQFEEINAQVEKIKEASDAKRPDYTLEPMVKQLVQTVKTWDTSTQPVEANKAVALVVRSIALHLWNEHQKLDFSMVLILMLFQVFERVPEVSEQLTADWNTLNEINERRKSQNDTGCLLQIAIFAVLGLIGALLQGC